MIHIYTHKQISVIKVFTYSSGFILGKIGVAMIYITLLQMMFSPVAYIPWHMINWCFPVIPSTTPLQTIPKIHTICAAGDIQDGELNIDLIYYNILIYFYDSASLWN